MKKLIIENFEKDDLNVEVGITLNGVVLTINIRMFRYEKWLKESDRLDWELNHSDYTGEHVQHTGSYTMQEYWRILSEDAIKEDLKTYIMEKIY
jgi:hypothetical protein